MGWTSNVLNELSELFVAACAEVRRPVLDVGAAFGVASLPALAAGATVIANDSDADHLTALEAATPIEHRDRLTLLPARFPDELALPPGGLDAIHASNIFHFLTGEELERGAAQCKRWLAPGGRLFVQAGTPYQAPFAAFVPIYEERVRERVPWPGWIEDTRAISSHRRLGQIPRSLHLLDAEVLERVFVGAGFTIERVWTYRRRDLPRSLHLDGREGVGFVAYTK